jgi:hypothetical protein
MTNGSQHIQLDQNIKNISDKTYIWSIKINVGISGTRSLGTETGMRVLFAAFYSSTETDFFTHEWKSC